jgi:hypothetical protein
VGGLPDVFLLLGVVAGGDDVRHLRQLDIHKPAYMWSVTLLAVRLHVGDYVSEYHHLHHHRWDVGADHGRGRADAAHCTCLLAPPLLIYIAGLKRELGNTTRMDLRLTIIF